MPSRLETLITLLHTPGEAALATNWLAMPGYPFATALAFATDAHHRPVVLISRLAEHTRNLAADARASLAVARPLGGGEIARASLVGELLPIDADARLVSRYLRFHPAAETFMQFGDFRFHRFEPTRIRVVGGFAQAGWLDGTQLIEAPHLPPEEEARLLDAAPPMLPAGVALLGLDAYGADVVVGGARRRISFAAGPLSGDAVLAALTRELGT